MPPLQYWQQAVIDDKAALDVKVSALKAFVNTDHYRTLSGFDRVLLANQLAHMGSYSDILGKRIERFEEAVPPAGG